MARFRDYVSAYKKALKGEPPDLSQLTPEQRARYEHQIARADQEMAAAKQRNLEWQRQVADDSVLYGPALPDFDKYNAVLDKGSPAEMVKASLRNSREDFAQAMKETADAIGRTEVDPAAQAAELAARTQARAPYRAPNPPDIVITRVATRGKTQMQELAEHLQRTGLAARPDLVHGVYRVPDRVSPNLTIHSEKGRVVEWAVVHHPGELPPTAQAVDSAAFSRHAQLIARRLGEPSVLDEEVAALYCLHAGVAPEWCHGFARVPEVRGHGGGEHTASDFKLDVAGICVLHWPAPQAAEARRRFAEHAPLSDPFPTVHHEVLDWGAIRARVQADRLSAARAPSPLPYLPATGEELLLAYLEIVGVQPGDSYGAQVTLDHPRQIGADGVGPKQPGADGKERRRLHFGERVVLSYRDRPEYVEGRARWAAYQHEQLHARLDHLTPKRPVLREGERGAFERIADVVGVVADPIYALDSWLLDHERPPSPFPYCWPPQ